MDIIADVVTRVVDLYNSLIPKVDSKSESDRQNFAKIEEILGNLKELISKLGSVPQSSISLDSLSTMFSSLETSIKANLAPLLKLINLMPTNAPPVHTRVQGGKKKTNVGMSSSKVVGSGSLKDGYDVKFFRKVMSTQIPTSLPKTTVPITSTTTTTSRPLTKGVVINSSIGGSGSKPPPLT